MAHCTNCGSSFSTGTKFCENCGSPLSGQLPPGNKQAPAPNASGINTAPNAYTQQAAPYNNAVQATAATQELRQQPHSAVQPPPNGAGAQNYAVQPPPNGAGAQNYSVQPPPNGTGAQNYAPYGSQQNAPQFTQQNTPNAYGGQYNYNQAQNMPQNGQYNTQYSGAPQGNYGYPPPPMQGVQNGYGVGVSNVNTGVQTAPKNKNSLVLGVVVVVLIGIFIVVAIMLSSMFSGSESDENFGIWTGTEIDVGGVTMGATEVYEDGLTLDLQPGGNCIFMLNDLEINVDWSYTGDGDILLDDGVSESVGTISGDTLVFTDMLGMGFDITFVRGYSDSLGTNSGELDDSLAGGLDGLGDLFGDDEILGGGEFIPPGYGAVETVPVTELSTPSEWYGTVLISNYSGDYPDTEGEYEAYGYLDTTIDGIPFFEIYVDGIYGSEYPVVSFYIDLLPATFYPIVDDEAWIMDAPLVEDDSWQLSPYLIDGVLLDDYEYDYAGEAFTFEYKLSQIG